MTDPRLQALADAFRSVFGDSSGHSPEQTARWFAAMHDADHAIRSVPHDVFDLRDKSALPDDGGGLGPDDFERAGLPQQDKSASPQRAAIVAAWASRDAEMVDSYLGAFFDHALRSSPNSATAVNGRNAALMLVAAVREESLRIAAAHLTDDAVVDALLVGWYAIPPDGPLPPTPRERKKMRAALAAAGKAWLGEVL